MVAFSRAVGAAILAALVSVAEAAEPRQLRVAGSHGHHHKLQHHKTNHVGDAAQTELARHDQQQRHASEDVAGAKMSMEQKFGVVQKKLMDAWKSKDHLEKLKHSIKTQKALLSEQKAMVLAREQEEGGEEERKQFMQMLHMVKDSKVLMSKVRKTAIAKTKQAIEEAMDIDKDADKEIEAAQQKMEEGKAEVARANEASATAQLAKKRVQKILSAAMQEAKYFQASSVVETKTRKVEEASQTTENTQVDEETDEQEHKEEMEQLAIRKARAAAEAKKFAAAEEDMGKWLHSASEEKKDVHLDSENQEKFDQWMMDQEEDLQDGEETQQAVSEKKQETAKVSLLSEKKADADQGPASDPADLS